MPDWQAIARRRSLAKDERDRADIARENGDEAEARRCEQRAAEYERRADRDEAQYWTDALR